MPPGTPRMGRVEVHARLEVAGVLRSEEEALQRIRAAQNANEQISVMRLGNVYIELGPGTEWHVAGTSPQMRLHVQPSTYLQLWAEPSSPLTP